VRTDARPAAVARSLHALLGCGGGIAGEKLRFSDSEPAAAWGTNTMESAVERMSVSSTARGASEGSAPLEASSPLLLVFSCSIFVVSFTR
jgi:hypothetical protein